MYPLRDIDAGGLPSLESSTVATYQIRTRRWTRAEYDKLIEIGMLHEDEPIELIAGRMLIAEPKTPPHVTTLSLTAEALRVAFGSGWLVGEQSPVALDDESEPEPDVIVVPGGPRDYLHAHPARPVLIVEVADSRPTFDRRYKGSIYARAGIADYWIVNLRKRALEVYREPVEDSTARFGWKYGKVRVLKATASVSPLAATTAQIAVADLLP